MCLAVLALAGNIIPDEHIEAAWRNNSDGLGFAYVDDRRAGGSKVVISKAYRTLDSALKAYKAEVVDLEYYKYHPHLLHLRFSTAGSKSDANVHPFPVAGGAMIHNGHLFAPGNTTKSDTYQFCESLHDDLTYENVKAAKESIGNAIGWSKLAFLYDTGNYVIVNDKDGLWDKGIWYSNSCYKSYNRK